MVFLLSLFFCIRKLRMRKYRIKCVEGDHESQSPLHSQSPPQPITYSSPPYQKKIDKKPPKDRKPEPAHSSQAGYPLLPTNTQY